MPTQNNAHRISTNNGVTLRVLEQTPDGGVTPARRTLILLHNFGGSAEWWREVAALVTGARLLMPDLRGFGESAEQPNGVGFGVGDMADDVGAVVSHFGLTNYALVGHSMGGKVAMLAASRRPIGLTNLYLLAPSPPTPEPIPDEIRQMLINEQLDRDAALKLLGKITGRRIPDWACEQFVADQLRSSPAAWRAWLMHGSREDISAQVANIAMPVQILAGKEDGAIDVDVFRQEVAARLRAPLMLLPGVGHLLSFEAAEETATFLL